MLTDRLLITHIKALILAEARPRRFYTGEEAGRVPVLRDAFLEIRDGNIAGFGPMAECPEPYTYEVINATGRIVLPTWVDSHTHLVFPAWREAEFVQKIRGADYQTIARTGGGILNSARRLRQMSEDELFDAAYRHLQEVIKGGTGAIEIKSGYGLTVESELKMLRVIQRLKQQAPIPVKATFLGAHAFPLRYQKDREGYIREIIGEMLPAIAEEGLAQYIDVFCEKVAFTAEETGRILEAGHRYGLVPKVHTNQFTSMGGIEMSIRYGARSVDHLEVLTDEEIRMLARSNTIATLLPSAPFFLNDPYPPARALIEAGVPVALASDFNPGSSPSHNMRFVLSLAAIKMKMLPLEAIVGATLHGAAALDLDDTFGSLAVGKRASLIITQPVPSIDYLPYAFGMDWIERVIIPGNS